MNRKKYNERISFLHTTDLGAVYVGSPMQFSRRVEQFPLPSLVVGDQTPLVLHREGAIGGNQLRSNEGSTQSRHFVDVSKGLIVVVPVTETGRFQCNLSSSLSSSQ